MIRWITDRLGTAPATSGEIGGDIARVDVRDLVDKHGNSAEAVRVKIDQGVALLEEGRRVVVCCDYGISRSNAVAAGILARAEGLSLTDAVRTVIAATGESEIKVEPLDAVRAALGEGGRRGGDAGRKRVLITGGTGFVGRHLGKALDGKVERLSAIGSEVDLTAGATALNLLVQDQGIDEIVHLANPRVYTSNRAMGDTLSMLRNVLDVCRSTRARLLFVSSWETYSGYRSPRITADENSPALPKGPYGETKMLCEQLLAHHRRHHGLDLNIVRSAPVYGAGSDKPKFLYNFARQAIAGAEAIRTHVYANGEPMLDLMHVDDLIAAIAAVVVQQPEGDFNIGGGRLWGTSEIAERLAALAGGASRVEQRPIADDVGNVLMDSRRARQVLGWEPTRSLEDAFKTILRDGQPVVSGAAEGRRLAIIGSSDLGQLVAHHARTCGWTIAGFIDNRTSAGTPVANFGSVLGGIDAVSEMYDNQSFDALAIGVGYLQTSYRREAFERFKGRIPLAPLVHPSAYIDPSCELGEGVVVLPGCTVDAGAILADNVLLNAGVVVAHHTRVGRHTFIGPAAAIAGKCSIGESCFIGINTTVIDHRVLCDGTKTGAAAVVTADTTQPGWYLGAPASWKKS